jgi:CDP-glucose 4,6-dehydratase
VDSCIADVRDMERLRTEMVNASPDIVIHMAAQPLVRDSYKIPVETYSINVMGTVHLLEAVRSCPSVRAVVNVTTDKCYENREWVWGYRENEPMGGFDPYSNSKGCSELVTASYRASFFNPQRFAEHGVGLASARAGNVIGGGDWAGDRLIPDIIRAILAGDPVRIRNPHAVRPWQHVLEPLTGYLALAQKLYEDGAHYAEGWNFGPADNDARPVQWLVERFCALWGDGASWQQDNVEHLHEAHYLRLDCSKAHAELGWYPRWGLEKSLETIVDWAKVCNQGGDVRDMCMQQIELFSRSEVPA